MAYVFHSDHYAVRLSEVQYAHVTNGSLFIFLKGRKDPLILTDGPDALLRQSLKQINEGIQKINE